MKEMPRSSRRFGTIVSPVIKKLVRVIFFILFILCFFIGAWHFTKVYRKADWSWPVAVLFGTSVTFCIFYVGRLARRRPAPFQLVLRMANNNGEDADDDQTFKLLVARFKETFSRASVVKYDGFDTDEEFVWFYFCGSDEARVRDAVLSQIYGCRIRKGSYFISSATQSFASMKDGTSVLLQEQEAA